MSTAESQAWINKAQSLCDSEKFLEAIDCYKNALGTGSYTNDILNNLGETYAKISKYQEALDSFQKCTDISSEYSIGWYNKGKILLQLQRYDESIKSFNNAIQYGSEDIRNKAKLCLDLIPPSVERVKETTLPANSTDLLSSSILTQPENPQSQNDPEKDHDPASLIKKARGFRSQEKFSEAIDCFEKAIALNTRYPYVWNDLGKTFVKMNRFQEALVAFENCVKYHPTFQYGHYNKGKVYLRLRQFEDAILCFDRATTKKRSSIKDKVQIYRDDAQFQIKLQQKTKNQERLSYHEALSLLNDFISQTNASYDELPQYKTIINGPQMIRGIAGSGKTLILCQKAAYIHSQHPEWNIVLIFFNRPLYGYIRSLVKHYTKLNNVEWDPDDTNSTLKIMHAWGSEERPGFYKTMFEKCTGNRRGSLNVNTTPQNYNRYEKLVYSCKDLLERFAITPLFDAILIDEGQDLIVDLPELLFDGKQPFYWLAYEALKFCNPEKKELKRLIWAFDEYQSLNSLKVPTAAEIFGNTELTRHLLTGGGRSIVMSRCYRTPGPILMAAHAIGMGLYSHDGMIAGPTTQKAWTDLGYDVEGTFFPKNFISLKRNPYTSPNPLSEIWKDGLISFNYYESREDEIRNCAISVQKDLIENGLIPRDILVICLNKTNEALTRISSVFESLNIPTFISTTSGPGQEDIGVCQDVFSDPNSVTVSRVYGAKGNEAIVVYIIGVDCLIENIHSFNQIISARNELFIAMTRTRAIVHLSGINFYPIYLELQKIIFDVTTTHELKFQFKKVPKRVLNTIFDNEDNSTIQKRLGE